jgi:hypothetical protein
MIAQHLFLFYFLTAQQLIAVTVNIQKVILTGLNPLAYAMHFSARLSLL